MIIRTPTDLTAYLSALAQQHPLVRNVITGEGSRAEESTLATAQYPQVEIETPQAAISKSQTPMSLWTRVYILSIAPASGHAGEDLATHETYTIGHNLISALHQHSEDPAINLALKNDTIELTPIISRGSDQKRGWMFDFEVEVDPSLCKEMLYDLSLFHVPQFSWYNLSEEEGNEIIIAIQDQSIYGAADSIWYWKEAVEQPDIDTFDGVTYDGLKYQPASPFLWGVNLPVVLDGTARFIHVWLRLNIGTDFGDGEIVSWAYARIDPRLPSGTSTPFIPEYPI